MSVIDIIILIPLIYGLIRGLFRGLFKEIASLLGIVFGLVAARLWADSVAAILMSMFESSETIMLPVAYILIFIIVAIGLNVLAFFIEKLLSFAMLGWLSKLAGGLFGMLKFWLIISVLVLAFDAINQHVKLVDDVTISKSVMYQPTKNLLAKCLPFFSFESFK